MVCAVVALLGCVLMELIALHLEPLNPSLKDLLNAGGIYFQRLRSSFNQLILQASSAQSEGIANIILRLLDSNDAREKSLLPCRIFGASSRPSSPPSCSQTSAMRPASKVDIDFYEPSS